MAAPTTPAPATDRPTRPEISVVDADGTVRTAEDLPVRWQGSAARAQRPASSQQPPGSSLPLSAKAAPVAILRLERLRLRSVLRVTAIVNVAMLAATVLAGLLIWTVASATGTVAELEGLLGTVTGNESFSIDAGLVLTWLLGIGGVFAVVTMTASMALAALVNAAAALRGGLEVEWRRLPDEPSTTVAA